MGSKIDMWISAYLYHDDPLEPFLTNGVKPFVEALREQSLIERFFFIRYWTKGRHIRLRLSVDPKHRQTVRQALQDYFTDYFQKHPVDSQNPDPKGNLYRPGTIRFVPYRPEIKRYGGKSAIQIAHRQFELSSTIILSLLANPEDWPKDQRLGFALQMMCVLYLSTLGKSKSQHLLTNLERRITPVYLKELESLFSRQKDVLLPYFARFLDERHFRAEAPEWLMTWKREMTKVGGCLKQLQHKGKFTDEKYQEILDRYQHMNNNRLGLTSFEELYMIYLLKRILTEPNVPEISSG